LSIIIDKIIYNLSTIIDNMKSKIFEEVILDNLERIKSIDPIKRNISIPNIKEKVKVIYGPRRAGKTYLHELMLS